ncbi:endothelin-converting enzyme 1-like [Watersipora subatra]|uniref:endothelin-converting enzyme 1-like n=1 Tax=Watersipora subatra TaxID=2589382 RepID=UPI00355BE307
MAPPIVGAPAQLQIEPIAIRNQSVDPCDNFYAYACPNTMWSSATLEPNETEVTVFRRMWEENEKRMETVLLAPSSRLDASSSEVKVKDFYQSCLESVNGRGNFANSVLEKAGGWGAMGTLDEGAFNFTEAIKKVRVDFWKDALFTVSVGQDWIDVHLNSIQVINSLRILLL